MTNTATHSQMVRISVNLLSYTKHVFLRIYEQAHFNFSVDCSNAKAQDIYIHNLYNNQNNIYTKAEYFLLLNNRLYNSDYAQYMNLARPVNCPFSFLFLSACITCSTQKIFYLHTKSYELAQTLFFKLLYKLLYKPLIEHR